MHSVWSTNRTCTYNVPELSSHCLSLQPTPHTDAASPAPWTWCSTPTQAGSCVSLGWSKTSARTAGLCTCWSAFWRAPLSSPPHHHHHHLRSPSFTPTREHGRGRLLVTVCSTLGKRRRWRHRWSHQRVVHDVMTRSPVSDPIRGYMKHRSISGCTWTTNLLGSTKDS